MASCTLPGQKFLERRGPPSTLTVAEAVRKASINGQRQRAAPPLRVHASETVQRLRHEQGSASASRLRTAGRLLQRHQAVTGARWQAAANCSGMRMLPSLRSSHLQVCRECFFTAFEEEVYTAIVKEQLLLRGERVAIGASGGKDSTVLAHILTTLNKRYE